MEHGCTRCAVLTLGKGLLVSLFCKQKINIKSSTEAELVGVNNTMNFVMRANQFVTEQVATVPEVSVIKVICYNTIIQQDNTSGSKLNMNEKQSSTKQTRHINTRFFYVTSKVKSG